MKYAGTLLSVRDITHARRLYEGLMGCVVSMDLGVHIAYTNGVFLQEDQSWRALIGKGVDEIVYGANNAELYFEEHEIESFYIRMRVFDVELVHELIEHSWGQRVVRFYDYDGHIIEVGEHLGDVVRRFLHEGMTREEVAKRMDVPLESIEAFLKE